MFRDTNSSKTVNQLLSVIIPTRNRAARVADLLDSLGHMEPTTFEWEVIVVDNDSVDSTREVTFRKARDLPIVIRYFLESKLGLHHGRHRGTKEASGEILAFLDDDMILDRRWVHGADLLVRGEADAVGGRVLPKWETEPPEWVEAFWGPEGETRICPYLGLIDLGTERKAIDPVYVLGGNCFIWKKTLIDLGGFHPDGMPEDQLRFRGDGETGLMMKFQERGLRSFYDPRATVFHIIGPERLTVAYFCQRAFNQGISDSFTRARADQGLCEPSSFPTNNPESLPKRLLKKSFRDIFKATSRRARELINPRKKDPHELIQNEISKAYRKGWDFHLKGLKKDPALRDYVLKETYLE
jgi:glucosyl-dolichyl phosphate glucuronosyltransferase